VLKLGNPKFSNIVVTLLYLSTLKKILMHFSS